MINWFIEYKDLLLFGQGIFISMGIYHAVRARTNGHRSKSEEQIPLNVEDVFEQLRETQPLRNGRSRHYIGTKVKATGSLSRVKELADDLVALSIIPHSALGSVTTGVSFSEYREIARGASDQDVTVEGQISFMSLDNSHELYLSDAKVYV